MEEEHKAKLIDELVNKEKRKHARRRCIRQRNRA